MAEERIEVQSGQNWKFNVDQAGTATLKTRNTYVDRDIDIIVPEAEVTLTATGTQGAVISPSVSSKVAVDTVGTLKSAISTTTAIEEGKKYVRINPVVTTESEGSASVSVSSKTVVSKEGYIATTQGDEKSGDTVNINNISVAGLDAVTATYLPVKEVTESNIEGVTALVTGENGTKDNFTVTLKLPAGYYDEQEISKDFSNLLPDFDENAATSENILIGMQAYDENGNVIVGAMANLSEHAPVVSQIGTGTTGIEGTSVTLSDDNNASGIEIKASGQTVAQASIDQTGYYEAGTKSLEKQITTSETVQYITDISVKDGKTLNSVATVGTGKITQVNNQGQIVELVGNGTIGTVSGNQTISNLTGSLTIVDSADADTNTAGSNGKITYKGTELVKDGALVKSSVTEIAGGFRITEGWVSESEDLGLAAGEYDVECEMNKPSVTLKATSNDVTLPTNGTYAITLSSDQITKGSHKATATIKTGGYLAAGSKSTETEEIDVTVSDTVIYLNEATPSAELSSTEKFDDGVSKYYEVSMSEGYIATPQVVERINVFDGLYAWA